MSTNCAVLWQVRPALGAGALVFPFPRDAAGHWQSCGSDEGCPGSVAPWPNASAHSTDLGDAAAASVSCVQESTEVC